MFARSENADGMSCFWCPFSYLFIVFANLLSIRSLVRWLVRSLACLCSLNTCVLACVFFFIAILRFCTHVQGSPSKGIEEAAEKRESVRRERDGSKQRMSIRSQIVAIWLAVEALQSMYYIHNWVESEIGVWEWQARNKDGVWRFSLLFYRVKKKRLEEEKKKREEERIGLIYIYTRTVWCGKISDIWTESNRMCMTVSSHYGHL